jgi:hypothetical protein
MTPTTRAPFASLKKSEREAPFALKKYVPDLDRIVYGITTCG